MEDLKKQHRFRIELEFAIIQIVISSFAQNKMRNAEAPRFGRTLEGVVRSGIAGVFSSDPSPEVNKIYKEAFATPDQYRSPRTFSNPDIVILEDRLLQIASECKNEGNLTSLPWSSERFSQGQHLANWLSYSDVHSVQLNHDHFTPERSRAFVDEIMDLANEKGRQLNIPEQFQIALELSDGDILGASVIAHAGSRSIARKSDTRVDPRFEYTDEEIRRWRDSISTFETITGVYGDPAADNYHFWGAFVAGLLSESQDRLRDRFFNPIYRQLFLHTAEATELLRYRLAGRKGETHKEADVVGYHLGSMVGTLVNGNSSKMR